MKFRLLLLVFVLGSVNSVWAQDQVDVTKLLANTKNFIFSNDKNTVKGYIYTELEAQTACCGQDRIYLEVKIDPSGYVLQVKPLTGSKSCYMQSAADIIKNIRWDASDFKGPKSVYFEIKPNIDCEGRNDAYTQVRIFNNEMLDPQGNRIYDSNPRPSASEVAANGGATPPATSPATSPTTQPSTPPVAETKPVEEPKTQPQTQPQTQPVAVEETPEPQMPPAQTKPVTRSEEENTAASLPMTTTANPNAMAEADRERQRAKQLANQSSIAQEDEIKFLKEQLVTMRQREEELREQRLADERAARQREQEAANARASEEVYTASAGDEEYIGVEGQGGLFFPDENAATPPAGEETSDPSATDPPKQDPNATEEQRLSERIADFERRLREMEQKSLERERRIEQEQIELERDNDQRLALIEEMMLAEEDLEQVRENNELDQLGRERTDIEDATLKTQDESQRLQDEMARLQQELEDKMAEIADKQAEIARLQELTIRREQEIQLARALREKEREARMMEERMRISGVQSSGVNISGAQQGTTTGLTLPDDFFDNEDSTRLQYLLEVIEQMRGEMQFLRGRIQELEGGAPASGTLQQTPSTTSRSAGTSTTPGVINPGGARNANANIPEGYNRADTDKSWEKIDNGIDLPVSPAPQQVPMSSGGQQPAGNKSPDASHRDTHANVAGPQFVTRTYAQGESVVKDMLKTEMTTAGVCGLAQSAFSVTLDPQGNVIGYRILASNQALVETVLMSVITSLKFTPADYPYNQVVYLDFKADINCPGEVDNTNLKDVAPLIKN